MMFAPALLPVLRAGTTAFIKTKPSVITLRRIEKKSDGAGGYTSVTAGESDPITVSLLEPKNSGYVDKSTIPEGTNTLVDFLLLAEHDVEIGPDDEFDLDGHTYRVENIMIRNGYEIRAKIVREAEGER